jgi:hypothetical protein
MDLIQCELESAWDGFAFGSHTPLLYGKRAIKRMVFLMPSGKTYSITQYKNEIPC